MLLRCLFADLLYVNCLGWESWRLGYGLGNLIDYLVVWLEDFYLDAGHEVFIEKSVLFQVLDIVIQFSRIVVEKILKGLLMQMLWGDFSWLYCWLFLNEDLLKFGFVLNKDPLKFRFFCWNWLRTLWYLSWKNFLSWVAANLRYFQFVFLLLLIISCFNTDVSTFDLLTYDEEFSVFFYLRNRMVY